MTIFRCSLLLFALLAGCEEKSPEPIDPPAPTYLFKIFRDGRQVEPESLLKDRAENPNAVLVKNAKRRWLVEGEVLSIREYNPVLDKIIGYGIPLKVSDMAVVPSWLSEDGQEHRLPVEDVSINVLDYDLKKASRLKVGQKFKVHCDQMRSLHAMIVFDDCREIKDSTK